MEDIDRWQSWKEDKAKYILAEVKFVIIANLDNGLHYQRGNVIQNGCRSLKPWEVYVSRASKSVSSQTNIRVDASQLLQENLFLKDIRQMSQDVQAKARECYGGTLPQCIEHDASTDIDPNDVPCAECGKLPLKGNGGLCLTCDCTLCMNIWFWELCACTAHCNCSRYACNRRKGRSGSSSDSINNRRKERSGGSRQAAGSSSKPAAASRGSTQQQAASTEQSKPGQSRAEHAKQNNASQSSGGSSSGGDTIRRHQKKQRTPFYSTKNTNQ